MNERQAKIVELTNLNGEIKMADLRKIFPDVAEITLRKDLQFLDKFGAIDHVYGGAKAIYSPVSINNSRYSRLPDNLQEKQLIGEKAAKLVKENMSIFIGAGTTCSEFAKRIPDVTLNVYTDCLFIAMELATREKCKVHVFSGDINSQNMSIIGDSVFDQMQAQHFDIAFIGIKAYKKDTGFSSASTYSDTLNKMRSKNADKIVALMDYTKTDAPSGPYSMSVNKIDILISDDKLDAVSLADFMKAKIQVL